MMVDAVIAISAVLFAVSIAIFSGIAFQIYRQDREFKEREARDERRRREAAIDQEIARRRRERERASHVATSDPAGG